MSTEPTPPAELDANLVEALRYGPFPRALRTAIAHRGLSLARLGAHLDRMGVHVGQSTLSYWQRGLRHPEVPRALSALRALERVLALPPDSLVVLVGDVPYYGRFGFTAVPPGQIAFPGPVNPARILACELEDGATAKYHGMVTAIPSNAVSG